MSRDAERRASRRDLLKLSTVAGLECTLHKSGSGLGFLYAAHFASCAANPGSHQEYKGTDNSRTRALNEMSRSAALMGARR